MQDEQRLTGTHMCTLQYMDFGWQATMSHGHYLELGKENYEHACRGHQRNIQHPAKTRKEREHRKNYNQHPQCNITSFPKLLMGSDLPNIKTVFGKSMKQKEIQTEQRSRKQRLSANVKEVGLNSFRKRTLKW